MANDLSVMAAIQAEASKEIAAAEEPELDEESTAMAEHKRSSFDIPMNIAKVDPLR